MNADKRLKRKLLYLLHFFDPKTSLCPLCQHRFKMCPHSVLDVTTHLRTELVRLSNKEGAQTASVSILTSQNTENW